MTATATEIAPDLHIDTPPAAPKFRVGQEIIVDKYFGVVSDADCLRHHKLDLRKCVITAVRLEDDRDEEWVGDEDEGFHRATVTYPKGWEYFLINARSHSVWGWEPESLLIEKGYEPAK